MIKYLFWGDSMIQCLKNCLIIKVDVCFHVELSLYSLKQFPIISQNSLCPGLNRLQRGSGRRFLQKPLFLRKWYFFSLISSSKILRTFESPHSSTLAWKISWAEEPGRLQSMGSLRVGHDWTTSLSFFTFMHWRRKWQPTLVFLPGESQGRGSLVGCCLWGRTESDTTEAT